MANYDNIIESILKQLPGYMNLNAFQSSVNSAVDAQEALAQTRLRDRVANNLAGRGIDPGSAYAESMFTDLWAPMKGQFTAARAGAVQDFYRSILSLAPMLINMAQSRNQQQENGYGAAPYGVPVGYITNPEVLTTPHKPSFDIFASDPPKQSGPITTVGPGHGSVSGAYPIHVDYSQAWTPDSLYDPSVWDYLGTGY